MDALNYASDLECKLIPYENAKGIEATREIIHNLKGSKSIGIFIGPEGGFEEEEVSKASENGFVPITLESEFFVLKQLDLHYFL